MRLGIKTDDKFLIKLNEKNIQIQDSFLEKIKEIAKKRPVDVMLQDGAVKKQETFDVEKIHQIYSDISKKLGTWTLEGISSTNDEGIRRNFIKLNTKVDGCKISLHFSIQYHVILFYQPNYEVMKKQKELSDFMDMTKKQEGELTEKSDHVILEKLRAEGYRIWIPRIFLKFFTMMIKSEKKSWMKLNYRLMVIYKKLVSVKKIY